jgi:hypothetical protein
LFCKVVSLPERAGDAKLLAAEAMHMTAANALALLGMSLIRFGGRGGGFVFLLFGLLIVGVLVWALTRSDGNYPQQPRIQPSETSPAPGAQK